jgi:ParB/RepB/Spo0J family partition protein
MAKPPKRTDAVAGNGKPVPHVDPINLASGPRPMAKLNLGVELIDPSPFQPRQHFPEEELRGLAESIRQQGQLQPVLLRPGKKAGRYELVDGERRWRAAKLAGLAAVRAEVTEFSDAQARQIVLASALQRADLSAIEEARAFRASLDAGDFSGPTELAAALGLSQGQVSNRLRLLELPRDVQALVISQEIPPTHARELLRLKDAPAVVSAVAKDLAARGRREGMPTVDGFRDGLLYDVRDHAQQLDGDEWAAKAGRRVPYFTPTDEQRAQLGIVAVGSPYGHGEEEIEFATNEKLWNKLQAVFRTQWLKQNPPGKKAGPAKKANGAKKKAAIKKLTPAEEAARAKKLAAQFQKALWCWHTAWLRWLVAGYLREDATDDQVTAVLMVAAARWGGRRWDEQTGRTFQTEEGDRAGYLREAGRASELAVGKDLATAVFAQDGQQRARWAAAFAARMFWSDPRGDRLKGEPVRYVPAEDVEHVAGFLGIDRELAWTEDQAGPLSEAFWNLHGKEQLHELAKEFKRHMGPAMKKSAMVAEFLSLRPRPEDKEAGLPLPKELKKVKRPQRTGR